jgi:Tat protein secretion system quality control protein TatD with DNase activity
MSQWVVTVISFTHEKRAEDAAQRYAKHMLRLGFHPQHCKK